MPGMLARLPCGQADPLLRDLSESEEGSEWQGEVAHWQKPESRRTGEIIGYSVLGIGSVFWKINSLILLWTSNFCHLLDAQIESNLRLGSRWQGISRKPSSPQPFRERKCCGYILIFLREVALVCTTSWVFERAVSGPHTSSLRGLRALGSVAVRHQASGPRFCTCALKGTQWIHMKSVLC